MAKVLDGHVLAEEIRSNVKRETAELERKGIEVGLALLLVGDNTSSLSYFRSTLRVSESVGIVVHQYRLSGGASTNEILNVIKEINANERINGLLVLFPLPRRVNPRRIVNAIAPEKDIDGLGSIAVGRLAADESAYQLLTGAKSDLLYDPRSGPSAVSFLPCTPYGVIRLLEHYGVEVRGKHCVVIGKSLAVGKPLALMLLAKGATVSVCHKDTADTAAMTRQADIVCSATGVRGLVTGDMISEGATVVDIGINVLEDGRIVGDVDYETVEPRASHITPVPGGVGPVTIAMLLENTVRSAKITEFRESPFSLLS